MLTEFYTTIFISLKMFLTFYDNKTLDTSAEEYHLIANSLVNAMPNCPKKKNFDFVK